MPPRRPRIRRLFAWAARIRAPRPFVTPQCRPLTSGLEVLEDRVVPASLPVPTRAVLGDLDGDMIPDLVTASGPGRTPLVHAVSGRDGRSLWDALPYDPQFLGGVELAIGDVTGDGRDDVITGAGPGAAPHATVIDGATGRVVRSWLAFDAGFHGGISVGAGDVTGDGRIDIIVGAGPGAGPHVEVFDGASGTLASGPIGSFLAFAATFRGGVSVSAGDVTGDGRSDIIVGAGPGAGPHVVAIDAGTGRVTHSFFVYAPAFRGGVRVAAADIDGNGAADIIATPLGGAGPHVAVYSGQGSLFLNYFAADPARQGETTIAASDQDGDGFTDLVAGSGDQLYATRGLDGAPLWQRAVSGDGAVNPAAGFAVPTGSFASTVFNGRAVVIPGTAGTATDVRFIRYRQHTLYTNSEAGLFAVDDATGTIGGLAPGAPGYSRAALDASRRIPLYGSGSPSEVSASLVAGRHYGLYLVRGGSADAALATEPADAVRDGGPVAWFSFPGANSDGFDHLRVLARNRFAFEDLPGGGDEDFNDLLVEIRPPVTNGGSNPSPVLTNAPPTISAVAAQHTTTGAATGPIAFRVDDHETTPARLRVRASSSNPALVPDDGIVFGGSGADRTVALAPVAGVTGTARVTLWVTDEGGLTASTEFELSVTPPDAAPAFRSVPAGTAAVGRPYAYAARAEGFSTLKYALVSGPAGAQFDPVAGYLTWVPTVNEIGTQQVVLEATDEQGRTARQSFTVAVSATGEVRGAVTAGTPLPSALAVYLDANVNGRRDAGERAVSVDASGNYALTGLEAGTHTVAIDLPAGWEVVDPPAGSRTFAVTGGAVTNGVNFTLRTHSGNHDPVITSTPPTLVPGTVYTYPVQATDPDGDPLRYSLVEGPAGMAVDPVTGVLTWPAPREAATFQGRAAWEASAGGAAATTALHFDGPTAADGLAVNDPRITPSYLSQGVRFLPFTGTNVYPYILRNQQHQIPDPARDGLLANNSSPNPVSDLLGRAIRFEFTVPTYAVGVVTNRHPFDNPTGDGGYMRVYDAGGSLLAQVDVEPGVFAGVSTSVPIGRVEVVNTFGSDIKFGISELALGTKAPAYPVRVRVGDGRNGATEQAFVVAPTASPNLIVNGGFETGPDPLPTDLGYRIYGAGSTAIPGWTVTRDTIDYEGTHWTELDGTRSIDLAGTPGAGAIAQTIPTVPGQTYRVAFDLGGNMYGGPAVKEMRVSAAGQSADFRFDVTNSTTAVMNWRRIEWTFVADGPTATLEFASLGPAGGSFGAVIDEVAVYAPAAPAAGPRFTSQPLTGATVGRPYRYAPTVAAPAGPVRFDLAGAPAGMSVDPATGALLWEPAPDQAGPSDVVLRVWDAVERSTTQVFRIVVHTAADNRAPRITSTAPDVARVAAEYRYTVAASDPDGDALVFALTEAPAGMTIDPTTGAATWTPRADQVGSVRVTVTATDPSLAVATQTFTVTVPDPAARPVVTITSPTNGALVGLPVEVTGSVASPGGQVDFYKVFYARADRVDPSQPEWDAVAGRLTDPDYVLIGEGRGPVANGRLAAFDPTALTDDEYVIVVAAFDLNGQGWVEPVRVSVTGGPKLGAFTLAVTDLEVPLAGIPITVTRVYDSREAGEEGDFGFGWRLGIADARIRETVPQTGDGFFATGAAFRVGTRVYLTNAEGKREGFTFQPVPTPAFFTAAFKPVFVPDPGVTDTLTVDDLTLIQKADGTFAAYLVGFPYNPDTYRLTSKDGRTYTYDQAGGLRTVTDRTGTTLTFTRDGITSSTGVSVRFLRDAQGRIAQVIDPDGTSIRYGYDGAGDLVTVTDRTNQVTTNVYRADRPHYLDKVYDPLQHRAVKTEFDAAGRLVATTDALDNRSVQAYDPDHFTETVADALGNVTTLVYDTRGNVVRETDPLGHMTLREYDAADNEIATTDPLGHVTRRTFDARRNVLSETDARAGTTRYTYNTFDKVTSATDALGRVTTYRYDAKGNPLGTVDALGYATARTNDDQGRPVTETDANGNVTSYAYTNESVPGPTRVTHADGTFRTIAYSALGLPVVITDERGAKLKLAYDASGRLLSVLAPDTGLTEYRYTGDLLISQIDPLGGVTLYEYDAANRLVAKTDALQGVTRYGYDKAGRLVKTTDPMSHTTTTAYRADGRVESVTDAAGGVTRYEYDSAGNRTAEIDALGRRRNYSYDELNRLVRKDDCPCPDEIYAYDAVGNLVSRTDKNGHITRYEFDALNRLVAETDALNGVTRYQYDANGNQTAVTDANGHTTQSTYDSRNRLTRRTDPAGFSVTFGYDGAGNQVSTTDQLGFITRFDYDGLGRLVRTEDPEHGVTSNKYDLAGDLVSTTDPLGRETQYKFDLLRRLIKATDAAGGIVKYEYDGAGNRTALTDPVGNRTTFGFDELNRQVRETDPLGHSINTRYDAVGNRIEVVDRDGRKRTFTYDELDRLTDETWWDGATAIRTIHSDYDAVGNLRRISDPDSTYQFSYDALDRQITVDNAGAPNLPHVVLTNRFDAVGNRIEVRDNAGVTVGSTYDARDLLTSRRWSGGGVSDARIDFTYDARAERTSVARYSDLADSQLVSHSSLSYDKLGRVSEIDHFGANGIAVSAYGYSYDAASQLAHELRNGVGIDYRYDAIDQLLGADRATGPDESYSYDAAGNRTGGGYQTGSGNRLLSDGTFSYSYDFEGNLVRKTEITTGAFTEYTYDYCNRLVSVTERDAGGSIVTAVQYIYDTLDRRIATTVNGVSTLTVHDGDATWADYNSGGDVTARYLLGDLIDEMLARFQPSEGTTWYLTDKLGTVRELLSAAGTVLNRIDYDSFGRILKQMNQATSDRFTFAGREFTSTSALYYYRARFYNPSIGRFNNLDPLRFNSGDDNLYRYVKNNPLNSTDPSGRLVQLAIIATEIILPVVAGLIRREIARVAIRSAGLTVTSESVAISTIGSGISANLVAIASVLKLATQRLVSEVAQNAGKIQAIVKTVTEIATAESTGDPEDPCGDSPLKGQKAKDIADRLGYTQRIGAGGDYPFDSKGQPVFRNPKTGNYISPDVGGRNSSSHKGGIWKQFNHKGRRLGTFDCLLENQIDK